MKEKKYCPVCGKKLSSREVEGRKRLYCEPCRAPIYENPIPATAAVMFDDNGRLLLVKRNVEPKAGQWCLPGGFQEMDESPENGCLRELNEETGLTGEIDAWAGNVLSENPVYRCVLVMGYRVRHTGGQLRPGDDCADAAFFDLSALPPIAFRSHNLILQNALNGSVSYLRSSPLDLTNPGCFGAYVITSGDHLELTRKACQAGARIIQLRDKSAGRRQMLDIARKMRPLTRESRTLLIINDYIDIALLTGADGVHLGQDDIPIRQARHITPPGFIIGVSTHSARQAADAEQEGADYIGIGPVFATPTKESYIPIGLDTVKQVIQTARIPVVAIGGLNPDNIAPLRAVGVKNFAMVRALQENTHETIQKINRDA